VSSIPCHKKIRSPNPAVVCDRLKSLLSLIGASLKKMYKMKNTSLITDLFGKFQLRSQLTCMTYGENKYYIVKGCASGRIGIKSKYTVNHLVTLE